MAFSCHAARPSGAPNEQLCRAAHELAHRFLSRFDDSLTRAECEDIVQDSAIAAWQWAGAVCEPRRFAAAVRTIARRTRCRALREHHRRRVEEHAACAVAERSGASGIAIAGQRVPREWLLLRLSRAIERLRAIDRRILLALQEGFCCAEIADRYGLTEENVKVRTHRARRRVRMEVEEAVRTAAHLDGFES